MIDGDLPITLEDFGELAEFLETQWPVSQRPREQDELRSRLARIYLGPLRDPDRAAPHVEALLDRTEVDPGAFAMAAQLVGHAPVAARMAELLSKTHARLGDRDREAAALAAELQVATQDRADAVRRRLAELRFRELDDPAGARAAIEPLVAREPGDDELRRFYLQVADTLGVQLEAAELLAGAIRGGAASDVRERVGFDVATLYLKEGELKQSRAAFLDVILVDGTGPESLAAARRLVDLAGDHADSDGVGAALEKIVRFSTDAAERHSAATQLFALHEERPLAAARQMAAYEALVDSPRADEALAWLRTFYERRGDAENLADVYRRQAERASDPEVARSLAIQSIEARPDESDEARIARWAWFNETFGQDRRALAALEPLLDRAQRWEDLAALLETKVEFAPQAERSALWIQVARTRRGRLADEPGALAAFGRCLDLDPANAAALEAVEGAMEAGEHRLAAASILERAYRASGSREGELRVLATRALLAHDPKARLASYQSAVDIAAEALADTARAMTLAAQALALALELAPDAIPDWLARLRGLAESSHRPDEHAAKLLGVLGDEPIDSPERLAIAVSAIDALVAAGATDRAIEQTYRALEADRASADLLGRIDELLGPSQPAEERLARYEMALAHATAAERRSSLRHEIATMRRDALGDWAGAMDSWRAILSEDPSDFAAYDALLGAASRVGSADDVLDVLDVACMSLEGREKHQMMIRKARALALAGVPDRALALTREVLAEGAREPALLQSIAEIASDEDDAALYRRALDLLALCGDPSAKMLALERLGDLFDRSGDRIAAANSWREAARMCDEGAADQEHARLLCERVLDAQPGDLQAAEQLVGICARCGDWGTLPGALKIVLAAEQEPARIARRVLDLESSAFLARAFDEYVSLIDEVLGRIETTSPEQARALRRARARSLGSDPANQGLASREYQSLIERFANEEDVRDFQQLVESRPDADERQQDRRWLYRFRTERSSDPTVVLLEWAKAEEEFGAPEAAISVYQRLAEIESTRTAAQESLCRLKLRTGDYAGGLAAFFALRARRDDSERLVLDLSVAHMLRDDLDRPVEAAGVVGLALASHPDDPEARRLAIELMTDGAWGDDITERFEKTAAAAGDLAALALVDFILSNDGLLSAEGATRRRWFDRALELAQADPKRALELLLRGAIEMPDANSFWDGAERLARDAGQPEIVVRAYRRAILERISDPSVAERLGLRMVELEDRSGLESSESTEALLRVLELCPHARWALDRVKPELGLRERYEELFGLFDRAVDAAADEADRGELLYEAAFAAKDLGAMPDRAIGYLESLRALRIDDPSVDSALERLYEKQNRKGQLIGLLEERLRHLSGFKQRDERRRIAMLWLDLGDAERAWSAIEPMVDASAHVADVIDVLERIVELPPIGRAKPAHERSLELLRAHYEGAGQIGDVVRIAERSLTLLTAPDERARRVRDLVGLRLLAGAHDPGVFARVLARVDQDTGGDPRRMKMAYRVILARAAAWLDLDSMAGTAAPLQPSTSRIDAENGAMRAIEGLRDLLRASGDIGACVGLLYRCSRLPLHQSRKRTLLCEAAFECSDRPERAGRALRIFGELFDDDASDDVARKSFGRFSELLEAAGEHAKHAKLWAAQAELRAAERNVEEERASWERAALLWERLEAWDDAVGALRRGAALGSMASFEALARIQAERRQWSEAAEGLAWLYDHSPAEARFLRARDLADAHLELGQRDRARACLERALVDTRGIETPDAAALSNEVRDRLMALYREDEVWAPLARLLAANAGRALDGVSKRALLLEAAELYRSKLNEPAEAAALLEQAATLDPNDRALRASLVEVLESLGRWDRAAEVLKEQIALWGEQRSKDRALLHHRVARELLAAHRTREALSELRVAADMHPAHPWILHDLAHTAFDLGEIDLAERTYRALLLAGHRRAEAASGALPRRADVFLDLGEIALRKGDPARASDLIGSAFDDALEHGESPDKIEHTLRVRGRNDLLARALERRIERGASLTERAVALGHLTDLWTGALGKSDEFGARIRRHGERIARDLDREARPEASAWAALSKVYATFEDELGCDRLAPLLEGALPKATQGSDRSQLQVQLAKIFIARGSRTKEAATLLKCAIVDDPRDREAVELLSSLLERAGLIDEIVPVLEQRLRDLPANAGTGDLVDARFRLANALDRVGRANEALPFFESVVDLRSTDPELLRALADRLDRSGSARLADCLEQWIAAESAAAVLAGRQLVGEESAPAMLLVARAEGEPSLEKKTDLLLRAAQRLLEQPSDPIGALRVSELAREADPESVAARMMAAKAQVALGHAPEALALLCEAEPMLPKRSPQLATLYLEMGRAHLAVDEVVEAFHALERGFVVDRRADDLAMLFGLVALDLNDDKAAERAFSAVTTLPIRKDATRPGADGPSLGFAYCQLATIALKKGDLPKARRMATRAVGSDPRNGAARALLEKIDAKAVVAAPTKA